MENEGTPSMKKIAIIGSGLTGISTFFPLPQNKTPLSILFFEQEKEARVGMPHTTEDNTHPM
ncbi:FAD/NAD(P)-binding protein, partial [Enterobacter soli]|uniref:FAD/NAD(P)-binding protein n=1 Tax=Enterobacter soli TaxID=885040 RepID=UPI003F5E457C